MGAWGAWESSNIPVTQGEIEEKSRTRKAQMKLLFTFGLPIIVVIHDCYTTH